MAPNPYEFPHASPPSHTQRLPWQRNVLWLLLVGTVAASLIAIYANIWEKQPLIPAFVTTVVMALAATKVQQFRNLNSVIGAIIGGALGANVAVALHFFCGYTLLEYFEDEGLGFVGGVLAFAPYATLCGSAIGGVVWLLTAPLGWINTLSCPMADR